MNVFELIAAVLDESFADVPGAHDAQRASHVKSALAKLSKHYANLASGDGSPSYGDAATRTGYVARYVTSHACLTADAIAETDELRKLFKSDLVQVACIGGGPGSDFLGVLKYMIGKGRTATLKCHLLDRDAAWGDSWSDVDLKLKDAPFRVSTHFQVLDVGDKSTWEKQSKYLRSDMFTMIYFVSEVWSIKDKAESYFSHVFAHVPVGAYFLYIDNDSSTFTDWFEGLASKSGLTLVESYERDARLPSDEQKAPIQKYIDMFGSPKLTAKVAIRVYKKA